MNYPERFFSKMFAWGRPLELARRFAIYSGIVLFLIATAAAAIMWARRSESARPYFIHVSDDGEWAVYSETLQGPKSELLWAQLIQESIADKYSRDYFRVPDSLADADALWCRCNACETWNRCRICCAADGKTYNFFTEKVLPVWRNKLGNGETQSFENRRMTAMAPVDERGGFWKITGDLTSNKSRTKKIIGFMKIERAKNTHPESLGFFVSEFYFYEDK